MSKFVITKRSNGEFQFNLKANNGEVILTSEGYVSKTGCEKGVESVIKNAPHDERYAKGISVNNKHYFNLKGSNGQIIGTSEMYESALGRDRGIESVKNNAAKAVIDDQTV